MAGRKAPKKDKLICDLCLSPIDEKKEDVLQCEGTCQLTFHRYCAGVSQTHYECFSGSPARFVCSYCSEEMHRAAITQLQSELAVLRGEVIRLQAALASEARPAEPENSKGDDRDAAIAALTVEVEQLKAVVKDTSSVTMVGERWSEVVRRGKGRTKRNNSSTGKKDDESTVMPRWVGVSIANTT